MNNAGIDLSRFVIIKKDGSEAVQYASDKETAVYLSGIDWASVEAVSTA